MKTRKYKTLNGLLRQARGEEISYYDLQCGYFTDKNFHYVKFVLSDDAKREACRKMAKVVWQCGDKTEKLLYYGGRNYGIFRRLTIRKKYGASYCAGQDYPGEIRTIQKIIIKAS